MFTCIDDAMDVIAKVARFLRARLSAAGTGY